MSERVIDNGLIVDRSTTPPTCCGYIFRFNGHGAFAPDGKVPDFSDEEIATHNKLLSTMEWESAQKNGRAMLYLHEQDRKVSTWTGSHSAPVYHMRKSWHNMAGKDGRTDVWFMLGGRRWHGVSIGDNQIVRCKATRG